MDYDETEKFIAWANTIDARIETSPGNVTAWHRAMSTSTPVEAHDAVIEHKRLHDTAPTPAGTRRFILSAREIRKARAAAYALEPPRPPVEEVPFRRRNAAEWDRLRAAAAKDREDELRAMSVTVQKGPTRG